MRMHLRSILFAGTLLLAACNDGEQAATSTATTTDSTVTTTTEARTDSASAQLELVFSDHHYQLTGVAKEPGGRLLVNYPLWGGPYRYAVVEATGDTTRVPYPDSLTNVWKPGQPGTKKWVCVQSVYVDDSARTWVLDPAAPQLKRVTGGGAKLVRMSAEGKMERSYSFNGVITDTSYVNDIRVDVGRGFAYITDSKTGGIVVVDLRSGKMREVLRAHPSTLSDTAFKFIIDGRELMKDGKPAKFHSDGIALTPDGNWLYYKPLTDDKLYRIATEHLRNWSLADTALGAKVEDLGRFTTTDGMIFDKAGNLYLGDLQHYRIVRIDRNHKMTTLVQDRRLLWPDSYSIADGYLYISCSQIHLQPDFNAGVNKRTSPYTIYRVRLP
ncbi:L-dopachrome tautomerase-related protein [Flaviaesturariibacter amylovorans]|uniref:L-dopachrome tautomerase-related protein n=1 Tax=Flaviaesturariibacter amylovorans TaxID=1084520 RepID=A0ABP8GIC9_9BACT